MSLLRPRVRDDRGRDAGAWDGELVCPAVRRAIERSTGPTPIHLSARLLRARVIVGVLLIAATAAIALAIPLADVLERLWVFYAGIALAVLLLIACKPWYDALAVARRVQLSLAHGFCPACGYSMQQLEPDTDDGCTVCPECGAAWRLDEGAQARSRDGAEG